MKIFGKEMTFPKVGTERWITYGLITVLAIALIFVSKCAKKPVTWNECEGMAVSYADTVYLKQIEELAAEYSRVKDSSPKGTPIIVRDTLWKKHTTFEKNWFALQDAVKEVELLQQELAEATALNAEITKEQFDKDGGALVHTIPIEDPIIETIQQDSGKHFNFEARILSRGQLVNYDHQIEVRPEIVKIHVQGPTRDVTKKNSLGITAGIIYFDQRNYYYPTTFEVWS